MVCIGWVSDSWRDGGIGCTWGLGLVLECRYTAVCVCVCVCVCMCVYVYMYECMYVFFIIFIGMLHYIILSNTTCYLN